jgi:hypothetical protein
VQRLDDDVIWRVTEVHDGELGAEEVGGPGGAPSSLIAAMRSGPATFASPSPAGEVPIVVSVSLGPTHKLRIRGSVPGRPYSGAI